MNLNDALGLVMRELMLAQRKHPTWPADPVYQSAIVQEEAGELGKAALQHVQEGHPREKMAVEAAHTAAVAIRFLMEE